MKLHKKYRLLRTSLAMSLLALQKTMPSQEVKDEADENIEYKTCDQATFLQAIKDGQKVFENYIIQELNDVEIKGINFIKVIFLGVYDSLFSGCNWEDCNLDCIIKDSMIIKSTFKSVNLSASILSGVDIGEKDEECWFYDSIFCRTKLSNGTKITYTHFIRPSFEDFIVSSTVDDRDVVMQTKFIQHCTFDISEKEFLDSIVCKPKKLKPILLKRAGNTFSGGDMKNSNQLLAISEEDDNKDPSDNSTKIMTSAVSAAMISGGVIDWVANS